MKKIKTLFVRDEADRAHVLDQVNPGCEWVTEGQGTPTWKWDGTACMLDNEGRWWTRREVKTGGRSPTFFRLEEHDPVTGKDVGWEPSAQSSFRKFLDEAVGARAEGRFDPGTYELCGPKINGNPEGLDRHTLLRHGASIALSAPRDYEGLRVFLLGANPQREGIVWHHRDGRMCKIKARDFKDGGTT